MVKLLYTERDETFYMKLVAHIVFTVVSDRVCIVAAMPLKDGIFEDNRGSWIYGLLEWPMCIHKFFLEIRQFPTHNRNMTC